MPEISGGDLVPALFLLAPGYATLLLVRNIGAQKRAQSAIEWTLSSLTISAVIAVAVAALHGLASADEVVLWVFANPLLALAEATIASLLLAVLLSWIIAKDFAAAWIRARVYPDGASPLRNETWDIFMDHSFGREIQVVTASGSSYVGTLLSYSTDDEVAALRIANPAFIDYAAGNVPSRVELGATEMLLMDGDIVRVVRLSDEVAITPESAQKID